MNLAKPYMPEALIEVELAAMWVACNRGEQAKAEAHWAKAKELIAARTPAQVARMEKDRGLV